MLILLGLLPQKINFAQFFNALNSLHKLFLPCKALLGVAFLSEKQKVYFAGDFFVILVARFGHKTHKTDECFHHLVKLVLNCRLIRDLFSPLFLFRQNYLADLLYNHRLKLGVYFKLF